jgi:outer membrane protein TolC
MTRSVWEDLETSRKRLDQARAVGALAEKAYTISKKAYELGGITLLEFQNSEQQVNNARLALNAAQFGFHSAVVDMRLLMGDYLFDKED